MANFEELGQALAVKADVIMLDNFSDADAKKAIALLSKKANVEISENVSEEDFESLRKIAPDFV